MPKNGNRGANTKRPNAPFASNIEDVNSDVIFGDAQTKRTAKQGSTAGDLAKKGGDIVTTSADDPPKKPDTRKLVGNAQRSFECCQDDFEDVIRKRALSLKYLLAHILS